MAQRMITQLIDDLDGKELSEEGGETVAFTIDGTSYEIDLSTKNADKFRGLFQDYIAAGRKISRRSGNSSSAAKRTHNGTPAAEIREWARSNGFNVPERGRIPAEVREAFDSRT